jgi:hypothetical protein
MRRDFGGAAHTCVRRLSSSWSLCSCAAGIRLSKRRRPDSECFLKEAGIITTRFRV